MKRLLACLALCASLSASAQDDNCTVLGVQELSLAYQELNASIDSITQSLISVTDSLAVAIAPPIITDYTMVTGSKSNVVATVNNLIQQGWVPFGSGGGFGAGSVCQAMVKYADD